MSNDPRYKVSREEIGIMLSFAKRPHAASQAWIQRLQAGVTKDELLEFFGLAGLPLTEASRIMAADTSRGTPVDEPWSARSTTYRRAVLGVLVVYVAITLALSAAAGASPMSLVALVLTLAAVGLLIHKVIVRLSVGMR